MDQKTVIELAKQGNNIFLTGRAGTGKTYTLNQIIEELKEEDDKVVSVTASTGIAATHLNGKTIHSWAGIGIKKELSKDDLFKIKNNRFSKSRIKSTDILIIDEISMLHDYILDLVNKVCQFIFENEMPFGGIQVIVCGDFFQLPPVNKNGNKDKRNYCFNSPAWIEANFQVCYLEKIYRQTEPTFIDILNNIRRNQVDKDQTKILESLSKNNVNQDLAVNLYCKNINVDILNATELSKINEDGIVFTMTGEGIDHLVEKLKKNCLAPEKLILKKGAHVMFLINNFENGIVNGTMGEIVKFDEHTEYNKKGEEIAFHESIPFVKVFKTGKTFPAMPYTWVYEEYDEQQGKDIAKAKITQIPLKLSWAITIHKSQGCTFDYINLNLDDVFEYSMGYVALSRATSMEGIYLSGFNSLALQVDNEIIEKDKEFLALSK